MNEHDLTAPELIALRRRKKDWSQSTLAAKAGYSRRMVSFLETGRRVSEPVAVAVLEALELDTERLLKMMGYRS